MADLTIGIATDEDIQFIAANLRERDQIEFAASTFAGKETAAASVIFPGVKRCLYVDGEPVFVGGLIPTGHGIVQAWGFGTDAADKYMLAVTKEIRRVFQAVVKAGGVKRIQAQAMAGVSAGWLKRLGLTNSVSIGQMNGVWFVFIWGDF